MTYILNREQPPNNRKAPPTTETNRLAQLIANADDKELGTRSEDGQPKRQDKTAALAIEAEYLFIRRDELPYTTVDEEGFVNVEGVDHSRWVIGEPQAKRARADALEYLAVAVAIGQCLTEQEAVKLNKRRDELAVEHFEGVYDRLPREGYRRAIDRIIELERTA